MSEKKETKAGVSGVPKISRLSARPLQQMRQGKRERKRGGREGKEILERKCAHSGKGHDLPIHWSRKVALLMSMELPADD